MASIPARSADTDVPVSDLLALYPMRSTSEPRCPSRGLHKGDSYQCSRVAGHEGLHFAYQWSPDSGKAVKGQKARCYWVREP